MNTQTANQKYWGIALTVIALLVAVWLVSPFIKIDRSDYAQRNVLGYRLALGLLIMILFVGKWAFDSLAPQGLARKVSNAKAVALILLSMFIMGFIVFIVAQATVLFLKTSAQENQQQTDINN
jgi:heme/copper-type cytochrome/quinol oxidase subunit 2